MTDHGGVKGAMSHGGADWTKGQGGVMDPDACSGAK